MVRGTCWGRVGDDVGKKRRWWRREGEGEREEEVAKEEGQLKGREVLAGERLLGEEG